MTQRRVILIGYTSGAEITVNWNGQEVFNDAISSQGDTDNLAALAEWQCDTSVTGPVPLSIAVSSGSMTFATVFMNYVQPGYVAPLLSESAQWTKHEPTVDEFVSDLGSMSESELLDKYGLDRNTLRPWLLAQDQIPIEENLREPFDITEDHDGKIDLAIDGVPRTRHSVREYWGAWQWSILAGQTLTCNMLVDPNIVQG